MSRKIEEFAGLSPDAQLEQANQFMEAVCKELNIEHVKINIGFHFFGCSFDNIHRHINLCIGQLNAYKAHPLVVLAHELRHAWQVQNKILTIAMVTPWESKIVWDGHIVEQDGKEHHELPWEVDAIRYERQVARRLNMDPFPRKDVADIYLKMLDAA